MEVHQKFGSVADASFTKEWYDSGTYDITWDPIFNVWLKSKSGDKFAVKFTKTLTQVIYLNEEGEWSLTGPHAFGASKVLACLSNFERTFVLKKLKPGTVLSISQGHGGYFITQPHSSNGGGGANLKALAAGSKNRKAISVALGPAVVSFHFLAVWFVKLAKHFDPQQHSWKATSISPPLKLASMSPSLGSSLVLSMGI